VYNKILDKATSELYTAFRGNHDVKSYE